jgi:hypothetical protein
VRDGEMERQRDRETERQRDRESHLVAFILLKIFISNLTIPATKLIKIE